MLDVALDELPRGRPQQMLTRHHRAHGGERHAVLQLIAEKRRCSGWSQCDAGSNMGSLDTIGSGLRVDWTGARGSLVSVGESYELQS
jgi:hypothetical protein